MIKEVKKCLWCSSKDLEPFSERKDKVGIVKCRSCKLVMVNKIPDNLDEYYYNEEYYNAGESNVDTGYAETYELMAPAFLFWQNSLVEELDETHQPARFLEIGCATGNLLDMIRDFQPNLDIEGIDISEYAAGAAAAKGHKASVAYIEMYNAKPKKDIIFSSETLEHLDDLRTFLEGVSNNLSSKGTFLFYVPSISETEARKEGENYIRFNHNLEHLLHFTPDFFNKEFKEFFDAEVLVKEFVTDFGPCIVGAVSKDASKLKQLNQLFQAMDNLEIPKGASGTFLKNLAILSVKFSKFDFAEKVIQQYGKTKGKDDSTTLILKGLLTYHRGELIKSTKYFEDYIKLKPGNDFAIRSILANEKELARLYEQELYKVKARAELADELEGRLFKVQEELNDIKNSKIGKVALKTRSLIGTALNPLRNQKKN